MYCCYAYHFLMRSPTHLDICTHNCDQICKRKNLTDVLVASTFIFCSHISVNEQEWSPQLISFNFIYGFHKSFCDKFVIKIINDKTSVFGVPN